MDNVMRGERSARAAFPVRLSMPFAVALALVALVYRGTFSWWWYEWRVPGSFYAHAIFVPFFVLVMAWRNRERFALVPWHPSWVGLVPLVSAMFLMLVAQRADVTSIESLSFVLLLFGISLLLLGTLKTKVLLFPLLFVVMMMPLVPDQLINSIAFPIQIASAKIATWVLNHLTLAAHREGTIISMENYKLDVELPCSGFKTLVSLLTFSAAFAYLVEAATWKRWLLFLTTAPLSLLINGLRITFIGVAGETISKHAAEQFHDWSGFIVLIMAFLFLFNFARLLQCDRFLGVPLSDAEEAKDRMQANVADAATGDPEPAWWQVVPAWRPTEQQLRRALPYVLVFDLILLSTLAMASLVVKKAIPDPPIATFQVPTQFTSEGVTWKAQPDAVTHTMDQLPKNIQDELNPIRVISRDYESSDGAHIQFFMTAGNGRKVFHDPHTCFLGNDVLLQDVNVIDIPTAHGVVSLQESRFKRQDAPDESEMMFCYIVEGRVVQRTEQVRNKMIQQMIFGDSGKPSYFFRVTQNLSGTDAQRRDQMVRFIRAMWGQIGPVLTGKAKAQFEPPPVSVKTE